MQNCLCFDTTSATTFVALLSNGTCIGKDSARINYQAEDLLCLVSSVIESSPLGLRDIDSIAVCIGPGSFTGIRTGIATAYGLGRSRNIAMYGISLPLAYALSVDEPGSFIVPYLKANNTESFYAAYFDAGKESESMGELLGAKLQEVIPIEAVLTDELETTVSTKLNCYVGSKEESSKIKWLDVKALKEDGNSAKVIGDSLYFLSRQNERKSVVSSDSMHLFSLNLANPLYVKAVNAPTLAERKAR